MIGLAHMMHICINSYPTSPLLHLTYATKSSAATLIIAAQRNTNQPFNYCAY